MKAPWVKWFPSDFLAGVVEMDPNHGWVYTIVLNLIYDHGGPIPDRVDRIARRCRMRPTTCEQVITDLVDDGKLVRGDGVLSNPRAEKEIESREKVVANSSEAARSRWEREKEKTKENNGEVMQQQSDGSKADDANQNQNQKLEKKERIRPVAKAKGPKVAGAYSDEFERLVWKPYPRQKNTSKKKGFEQFSRLSPDDQALVIRSIPAYAAAMKAEGRSEDKIKHLEFYLSGRVFETVGISSTPAERASPATATRKQWAQILIRFNATNNWRDSWGPEIGRPGCFVPLDMVKMGETELRQIAGGED